MKVGGEEPTVPFEDRRRNLFETLKLVAKAIVATFGEQCEVVIHDLTKPEASIVWIEGNITGRTIGGSATDLLLRKLRHSDPTEILSYRSYASGKIMTSSTMLFADDETVFGAMCINFDVSALIDAQSVLRSLSQPVREEGNSQETFVQDVTELLETMIAQAAYEIGTPIELMNKDVKVRLTRMLEERGAFQIKKAVPVLALRLGVSRFTIYNYLNEVRKSGLTSEE